MIIRTRISVRVFQVWRIIQFPFYNGGTKYDTISKFISINLINVCMKPIKYKQHLQLS